MLKVKKTTARTKYSKLHWMSERFAARKHASSISAAAFHRDSIPCSDGAQVIPFCD
jgi:hypothetical protein